VNRTIRIILLALSVAFVAGACSDDEGVGSDVTIEEDGEQGGLRPGETTTTAPPAEAEVTTTAPPTTAKPKATTTVPPEKPCTKVKASDGSLQDHIIIGNANTPYDPRSAAFRTGAVVCWKNNDSVSHQVEASNGVFRSGPIAPGAVYRWTVNTGAGKINYADPDRPFAVGELIIQ
jgi:plastocyanin/predicted small secreted protein